MGYIVQPGLPYGGWNVLIFSVKENDGLHIRNKLNVTPYRGKMNVTAYGHLRTLVIASRENSEFNPLNPELNPICYLLALLEAHNFLHIIRIRVKLLTFRLLMSYIDIYGAPILDVSRSHTTTQHSR